MRESQRRTAHQKGEISIRTATFPQSHFYRADWISGCRGRCSSKVKVAPGTALSFHRGATSTSCRGHLENSPNCHAYILFTNRPAPGTKNWPGSCAFGYCFLIPFEKTWHALTGGSTTRVCMPEMRIHSTLQLHVNMPGSPDAPMKRRCVETTRDL